MTRPTTTIAAAAPAPWGVFTNAMVSDKGRTTPAELPDPPPWRRFDPGEHVSAPYAPPALTPRQAQRGAVFRLPRETADAVDLAPEGEAVRLAVNAAIQLRRPLLITGTPGCGKTSLAYAIAHELGLGRVLCWPITPRSELQEGLYRYEALDRLRESSREMSTAEFITLGPLGTAFLPFASPRVLLIDEIDKSDLQLPNELLHLFEEGAYEIPQLRREARLQHEQSAALNDAIVDTDDPDQRAVIRAGRVQCRAFPIVVMTSNRERDFPPAFHRRCIRVEMPSPTSRDTLLDVARQHLFAEVEPGDWDEAEVLKRIDSFLPSDGQLDRATDQLLNALHLLLSGPEQRRPSDHAMKMLQEILFKRLSEGG